MEIPRPKIAQRFRSAIKGFTKSNNAMGEDIALSRQFLKHGNARPLVQDWSKVMMSDRDFYTGYPYAAIDRRANKVATLAKYNLKTDATPEVQKEFKAKDEAVRHPYLDIIDKSKTFSNRKFWYDISTYLDLEGVYYLLVVRAFTENRTGNIQEFQLLNPYNIRRIRSKETLEIGGYVETRDGLVREFNPKMIVEMRKLNPFDDDDPFAMTDAAKNAQFTLQQGGDYTRHSLKNNMAAPGIISTDVLLDPQQFANFVNRVTNQEKGLPLFGNGAGAITWDSMQIDMDKAGLKDINEINRQELMAVSGAGKTLLSIEESGTTRDTADIQGDLFIEYHAQPQLELILDALNQDYKIYYEAEYDKNKFTLEVSSPLDDDQESELKGIDIRSKGFELYNSLVNKGYDRDLAARFAQGEISLEELGEPTNDPVDPIGDKKDDVPPEKDDKKPKKKTDDEEVEENFQHHDHAPVVINDLTKDQQGIVTTQQGALQNAIQGIEGRMTASVINRLGKAKNEFEETTDIMPKTEQAAFEDELAIALGAFYGVVLSVFATQVLARRARELGLFADFKMNPDVKRYIKETSRKASESHVNTVLEDLRKVSKESYDEEVKLRAKEISGTDTPSRRDLVEARKLALEGASQQRIISNLRKKYDDISQNRAKAIARTETNRAFTQSQFQADVQFIKQNNLQGRAFKQWITRSGNPCRFCLSLAARPPIPFVTNFANLGDVLSVTYEEDGKTKVGKLPVNFEALTAGNAHTNCSCAYQLIIE